MIVLYLSAGQGQKAIVHIGKAGGVGHVANTQRFFEESGDLQGFVATLEHNRRTGLIVSDGSPHMNSLAPVLNVISLQDLVHRREGERRRNGVGALQYLQV